MNLGSVLLSGIPEHFMEEKGIFKMPVTITTACRFCGNGLLGKLSRAVICNDLEYCVQFWVPQYKRSHGALESVQRRATRMGRDLPGKL